ncbi:MAG: GxxExxY protein [Ignavibacteriaceae bacterium]
MNENFKYSDVTERIIKGFFNVYNKLGGGFLEKVYENALMKVLTNEFKKNQTHPFDLKKS